MNYKETIAYLYNATPVFEHIGAKAYKPGLYTTHELDRHFDFPHHRYKTIHIAGTNGKGSCSHSIAAILQEQGYKVGLYTSPHLTDFRERIRINGECISERYVIDFVEQERAFFEPLHPSFFELATAMAFKYFDDMHVDVAVIEVGLGGRLDCTNIISPVLSVITNISFDHMQFLGNTLPEIAAEKAGIIKRLSPVIIGEANDETRPVFTEKAQEEQAPVFFAEDEDTKEVLEAEPLATGGIRYVTRHFGTFTGELSGEYQIKNMNTILCAVRYLTDQTTLIKDKRKVTGALGKVCALTGLQGRWQTIGQHPLTVCDTGHNVAGWQYLAHQIKEVSCRTCRIVFGMVDDKEIDEVMRLLPTHAVYYFTQASCKRAFPAQTVAAKAQAHGLKGKVFATVPDAYLQAKEDSSDDDFIFVGGSSYVVADFLTFLQS